MRAPVLGQCPSAPSRRFLRKVSLPRTPFGPHGSLRVIGTLGHATQCYAQAQALFTQVRGRGILRSSSNPRSRKSEVPRESTVLGCASDKQRTRQGSAEGVGSAVLVCDGDHAVQDAHLFYGEQPSWDQPALS